MIMLRNVLKTVPVGSAIYRHPLTQVYSSGPPDACSFKAGCDLG